MEVSPKKVKSLVESIWAKSTAEMCNFVLLNYHDVARLVSNHSERVTKYDESGKPRIYAIIIIM